ncbi:hypothetical protein T08_444 [Trichinella sp. T8]|nr:hypothetical protein T08_444 [Trichinella sp. T8]
MFSFLLPLSSSAKTEFPVNVALKQPRALLVKMGFLI